MKIVATSALRFAEYAHTVGAALGPWTELHRGLHGFGWNSAEGYEREIRAVLG